MATLAVVLAAALAFVCIVFVARPFLREPETADDRLDEGTPRERERVRLAEVRDRALAALKELEFDHRVGKISDADYREQVGVLRREAAEAIKALGSGEPGGEQSAEGLPGGGPGVPEELGTSELPPAAWD